MNNLFNAKLGLISLVLICIMQNFSTLKGNNDTVAIEIAGDNESEDPAASTSYLRSTCSKLMSLLHTAKSRATKRIILATMMTAMITYFLYHRYHTIPIEYEEIMSECQELNQCENIDSHLPQKYQIFTTHLIQEYNKFWPFLYNKVTQCAVTNPGAIKLLCKSHLETLGLGEQWNRISTTVTDVCQDSTWCWTMWEALKKLPKIF